MSNSDWDRIRLAKEAHRAKLADLPFAQKLEILERLRERAYVLSGRRGPASAAERQPTSQVNLSGEQSSTYQNATGAIRIGSLPANATMIVAAARGDDSWVRTTITMGPDTTDR